MTYYEYGMKLRGFSPGAQPMDGLVDHVDGDGRYWDFLYYNRELTKKETNDYDLDFIQKGTDL